MLNFSKKISHALDRYKLKFSAVPIDDALTQDLNRLSKGNIKYLLIQVKADDLEKFGQVMGVIVDLTPSNNFSVVSIFQNTIFIANGVIQNMDISPKETNLFAAELVSKYGEEIKIVYGNEDGYFGLSGGQLRVSYNVILPSFDKIITKLITLNYGETFGLNF